MGRWGGLPPLPTHPPLRFTREQTRVEYIRRCRLKIPPAPFVGLASRTTVYVKMSTGQAIQWAYLIGGKFGPREVHKNNLRLHEAESSSVGANKI